MKNKKILIILMVSMLATLFVVSNSWALAINTRPISIPAGGTLDPIQAVFTNIGSSINVYNDQEAAAIYEPTGSGSTATYIASVSWGAYEGDFELGLYKYGDPNTRAVLLSDDLIAAGMGIGDDVSINFVGGDVGLVYWSGSSVIGNTTVSDFGTSFGFYIDSIYGTWFSEDDLNNDQAQILTFFGKGDNTTFFANDLNYLYAAFEGAGNDGSIPMTSGNIDFDDWVVAMESTQPIPEPATMLLLGSGLIGLAGLGRKKFAKRA